MKKESQAQKKRAFAQYSGMAFQMIAIILIGVFGGIKLDEWMNNPKPIFTIILTILAVVVSIYFVIKDLLKINK